MSSNTHLSPESARATWIFGLSREVFAFFVVVGMLLSAVPDFIACMLVAHRVKGVVGDGIVVVDNTFVVGDHLEEISAETFISYSRLTEGVKRKIFVGRDEGCDV